VRSARLLLAVLSVTWTAARAQTPPSGSAQAAPAIRVPAEPRSFRIVTVPVPAVLPGHRVVRFEIVPAGTVTLLGALDGTLLPTRGGDRVVVFTAVLSARARAGVTKIAHVRWSVAGGPVLDVPVELEVARVPGADVKLTRGLVAVHPGGRLGVGYLLTNTGNAPDSLEVALTVPKGWQVRGPVPRHVLEPDGTAQGTITVTVPRAASTGAARLRLVVRSSDGERTSADAGIEVVDRDAPTATYAPRLTAGVATVVGDTGPASAAVGFTLDGQLSDRLRVNGRLVQGLDTRHVDTRGLGRVGYFVGQPYLTLATDRWQATGGTTGVLFSDLTGVNLWGKGGSFSGGFERWRVAALAARPPLGGAGGRLLGAQVAWRVGEGWVSATATDLEDGQAAGRRLRAFGVGGSAPLGDGTTVAAELADRRFAAGEGVGWLTELRQRRERDHLLLRYVHAPGGSGAFARVRNELSAFGSRALPGGVLVSGGFWVLDDESAAFSRLYSSGWSFSPQIPVDRATTAGIEARGSSFDATGASGAFGNSEHMIGVVADSRLGRIYLSGATSIGRATRTATTATGVSSTLGAGRATYRGLVGWGTDRGNFQLSGSMEQNGAGTGLLPRQYIVGLQADRVPVRPSGGGVLLSAAVQHYGWFGDRPGANLVRLGLSAPLGLGLLLTADIERNPFVGGSSRWITALKIERAMHVPLDALRPAVHGVVYEDRNANARRDPDEPGVPGAVVRRGAESVVTDQSGRFRFYERSATPARLDETSLPFGMVVNAAALPPPGARRGDIGVIPTAPVEVQLLPMPGDDQRVPKVDFRRALVRARGARGDFWTAQVDSAGLATFYALPPGQYELDIDLTGLSEPLQLRDPARGFTVEIGSVTPRLKIPVYPRRIRMRDGSKPGSPGSPADGSVP
jgi:hypothetical protein